MDYFLYLCTMISNILTPEQVAEAHRIINSSSRFVIFTHMSPDGDAMGSSLGMRHWLEEQGKQVTVIVPNNFPDFLTWMPGADMDIRYDVQAVEADQRIAEADVIICTDFNEPDRIGMAGQRLIERVEAGIPCIIIDHHIVAEDKTLKASTPCSNVLPLIFSHSPSASELVYRFIIQLSKAQKSLSIEIATCLYTGMMTDTGNFSFNSNYPEMYEIIGELVRLGVDKDAIYNRVFNAYKANRMRLMGYCLYEKMRIFEDYHLALINLNSKELHRFNFQSGDAEGLVNLPLQIKNVYYSCFMREDKVNPSEVGLANGSNIKVKISMRSQGNRPVNEFCHKVFHGGGHLNASGGEYYGSLSEAIKLFMDNYAKFLKQE